MPRVKNTFNAIELRDSLSLASIINTLPMSYVNEALEETTGASKRNRVLPNYFVIYLTIFLCIFKGKSTDKVLEHLFEGLESIFPGKNVLKASDAAISKAREKVGDAPMQQLFSKFCRPLCSSENKYAFYQGLHKYAIDESELYLVSTRDVLSAFPAAANDGKNPQNCPKIKFGALMEIGSHAYTDVEFGGVGNSEQDLADPIIDRLGSGKLIVGDRYYPSVLNILRIRNQGSEALFRASSNMKLTPVTVLRDGSWLAQIVAGKGGKRHSDKYRNGEEDYSKVTVRVIEAHIINDKGKTVEQLRLVTTLEDHVKYHAQDLIDIYTERWEEEMGFKEIKAHLMKGAQDNLRSKKASLVRQEFWAMLIAHYIIRKIIYEASGLARCLPNKLSFTGVRDIIQRKTTAKLFPPSAGCEEGDKAEPPET